MRALTLVATLLALTLPSLTALSDTKNLARVKEVFFSEAGYRNTNVCALHESGELWCWGRNQYGVLGFGDSLLSPSPRKVEIPGKVAFFRGGEGSFVLTESGDLWSWGKNAYGVLGLPLDQTYLRPVQVQIPDPVSRIITNSANIWSNYPSLAITTNGDLYQLGHVYPDTTFTGPLKVLLPGKAADAYAINGSFYAVLQNGDLWAWGENGAGQLGLGHSKAQSLPAQVSLPTSVVRLQVFQNTEAFVEITAGGVSVFAILTNGDLFSWGSNADGVLGNGRDKDSPLPMKVPVPSVSKIFCHYSDFHQATYALTSSGDLYAWGANFYGSLGIGEVSRHVFNPTKVNLPSNVQQLHVGQRWSTDAVLENGEIWHWGILSEAGTETPAFNEFPHVVFSSAQGKVKSLTAVTSIAYFATLENSETFAWGSNRYGELLIERATNAVITPTLVPNDQIQRIWAAPNATCVTSRSGLLRCLGNNEYGGLGQGHTNFISKETSLEDLEPINF